MPAPKPDPGDDQSVWMYLAGLTSVADWIGSNQEFFEPVGNPALVDGQFDVDDYFGKARPRGRGAGEARLAGPGGHDHAGNIRGLVPAFTTSPAPDGCGGDRRRDDRAELAYCGSTDGRGENRGRRGTRPPLGPARRPGGYVALPTMATSNQMFDRVGKFLEADAGKKNLMLLHGKAALNDHSRS